MMVFGLYDFCHSFFVVSFSAVLMSYMASVSSCRCNPSSGPRPHHHCSAAAHDRLSSQTCPSQDEESPTPNHRGVRLPHQRHVPVANQTEAANTRAPRSEREVSSPEPEIGLFEYPFCF